MKAGTKTGICTLMFIAAIFLTPKAENQLTDEWINQMWCIHTMKYCSALKRNGILAHAIVYTNLKDIMLSEISQTQKDKYCTIPLT